MKPNINKNTGLFLILLGVFPLLLVVSTDIRKAFLKNRMREKTKLDNGLHTIMIPETDVVWMDKHEIFINDQMFDISNMKLDNGVYTFTGLYDKEETELVKQQQNTSSKNNKDTMMLIKLFKCLYNLYYSPNIQAEYFTLKKESVSHFLIYGIASCYKEIPTPPPQCSMYI
ncbi:MAG: hypothetical protein KA399_01495 [Chitinophagaceae bacterium]|nr:hypothetical protein [Chitinophagaceae bacterium]